MQHKCFFPVTFLTILSVFFCFGEGSAAEPPWSTTHKDKEVKCTEVDYPTGLIPVEWNWFSVTYTTQAEGKKYTWTYSCDNDTHYRSVPDSSHTCTLMDDGDDYSFSLPSDFDPGQLVGVDLEPGTPNAQEKVCREIFKKSQP